jgi:hypothetical protein
MVSSICGIMLTCIQKYVPSTQQSIFTTIPARNLRNQARENIYMYTKSTKLLTNQPSKLTNSKEPGPS